jgi:hypothetical protein
MALSSNDLVLRNPFPMPSYDRVTDFQGGPCAPNVAWQVSPIVPNHLLSPLSPLSTLLRHSPTPLDFRLPFVISIINEQSDEVVLSGSGFCWSPSFTWHGFRYVEVSSPLVLPPLSSPIFLFELTLQGVWCIRRH